MKGESDKENEHFVVFGNLKTEDKVSNSSTYTQSNHNRNIGDSNLNEIANQSTFPDTEAFKMSSSKELDQITTNTLFISVEKLKNLKPISLFGRYIGVTGMLQQSVATSQLAAVKRSATEPLRNLKFYIQNTVSFKETADSVRDYNEISSRTNEKEGFKESYYLKRRRQRMEELLKSKYKDNNKHLQRLEQSSPSQYGEKQVTKAVDNGYFDAGNIEISCVNNIDRSGNHIMDKYHDRNSSINSSMRKHRSGIACNDGIDYSTSRCINLLAQEKDLLMQGWNIMNSGAIWFQRQICGLEERKRALKNVETNLLADKRKFEYYHEIDYTLNQDQLNFLSNRIFALSQLVKLIKEFKKEKVEASSAQEISAVPSILKTLREKNHNMAKKISSMTMKAELLENEKSVLIQQLFQAKAEVNCVDGKNHDTSIFI